MRMKRAAEEPLLHCLRLLWGVRDTFHLPAEHLEVDPHLTAGTANSEGTHQLLSQVLPSLTTHMLHARTHRRSVCSAGQQSRGLEQILTTLKG